MERIGFLGTGIMGFHMARRLAEAGYQLTAWNRSQDKAERLRAFGVGIAPSPADACSSADVVICMLSDGPTSDEILFNAGAVAAMPKGGVVVVMSSIPMETAQQQTIRCGELGQRYVDAPVSGGEKGAAEGTLAIMAGGAEEDVSALSKILSVLGRPTRVGPAGMGSLAKLCNQMIVANSIAGVAEALLLARRGGADPAKVRDAIAGGFADSPILRQHGLRMIAGDFSPGGPAKHQLKDVRTAMATAERLSLDLPVTALVTQLFEDTVAHGDAEFDHSVLYRELERRNKLS